MQALHFSQHFIDRIEGFFQPVLRRHGTALRQQGQCSLAAGPLSAHRIEQCGNIDLRGAQRVGRLGIGYPLNIDLDFRDKTGSLLGIARTVREQVHEIIHAPRRRFQPVTIDPVDFEVH